MNYLPKALLKEFKKYIAEIKAIEKDSHLGPIETYELFSESAEYILRDYMLWSTDKETWAKELEDE